jgi:SAM-dependent methyltransferase
MSDYDLFARFYDLEHQDLTRDVELYRNYAVRCDGAVLELGCGAGRVALALARAGYDVLGIDNSAAMLSLARLYTEQNGLSQRITLRQMDVRAFAFEDRFALALYPLNGFLHLTRVEDQRAALRNVYRALLPGGMFLVDLPNPHAVFTPDVDGQLVLRRRFRSPDGAEISSYTSTQTDLAAQLQRLTLLYDEVGTGGLVRRTTVEMVLRFVYRYEMAGLLHEAGFKVDEVYGTYDLDPYEADSEIMLFVAHK